MKKCSVYRLTTAEMDALKLYIEDHLRKGYIQRSKSPVASPFFFVNKKDGKLRPVQDYRALNDITVKNATPLPLIPDLIDKLQGSRYFTKFDVRWGYNNIRIRKGDEWKAAFKCALGTPPEPFDGAASKAETFLSALQNYYYLNEALYNTQSRRVAATLSHFKVGTAAGEWAVVVHTLVHLGTVLLGLLSVMQHR
jgi:hypothetical protein